MFEKFGTHQPLNRQRDRYAREGVEISLSTLADHVGACASALRPLHLLIEAHVLAAERLHGDDTTVPVLAKTKADVGRCATIDRSEAPRRQPPCSITRGPAAPSIRSDISPAMAAFCKPTPMPATTRCSRRSFTVATHSRAVLGTCQTQVLRAGRRRRAAEAAQGCSGHLADVLARIVDMPQNQLNELLPWNWRAQAALLKAA